MPRSRFHFGSFVFIGLLLGFHLMSPSPSLAASDAAPRVVSLEEALKLAIEASPLIKEEQFGVLLRQSQLKQANAARFAQLDLTVVGGPSPRARGNQISSPDSKGDPEITGVFGTAVFSIIQPLYTFGKIKSFRQAAAHGIAVSEAQVHQKATEVAMLVYEAFYGYQLATALENLALEISDQLTSTLETVRQQLEAEAPGVDNIDLFKLQTFEAELNKQLNDIRQGKAFALDGLHTLMDLPEATPVELAETALQPVERSIDALEHYLSDARQLRPEFTQAREGIKAFEALVRATKADYYPLFFAGLVGSLAESTNRDYFTNPFVFDSLHDDAVAPVVGFKWHYDLGITAGKVDEAKAQLGQVQQKQALAQLGIPFQVRQARQDVERHQANITATRQGYSNGRKWFVAALSNFDLGVGEGKDLADAALAYARMRAEYFQAVYNYNLAVAKLDHAAGRDVAMVQALLPPARDTSHVQP
jgi:outer membrane protein